MTREGIVRVTVSPEGIRTLGSALRAEEDGRALRRELARDMRNALKPYATLAKSSIMSMRSAGLGSSPRLRSSIAKKIRPEVKLGGRWTGARVKAFKTRNVRNFPHAPKRTNRASGWRHPVFGDREVWVDQTGKIDWFDRSFRGTGPQARQAVHDAMENLARRIAARGPR